MIEKNLNDSRRFSAEGLTKIVLFSTPEVLCFVLNLMPGQQIPDHRHEDSVLTLAVLQGKGSARVSERSVVLSSGTVLMIEGCEDFGVPAVEENLSLLATLSPNPENPAYSAEINS